MAGAQIRLCGCMAVAVSLACAAALTPGAAAKKTGSAATKSASVPLASSQTQSASASCPGKMHVTGGGFAVSPLYDPATGAGTRTLNQVSHPVGKKQWQATGSANNVPISAGTFTTYARCEKNSLGKIAVVLNSSAGLAPKAGQSISFSCPRRTHAISGGFGTDRPFAATDPASSALVLLQSQRTGARQWTVSGYNASATVTTTLIAYAACELNAKNQSVSQATATAAVINDRRTVAEASCPKKQHPVSGGFLVMPLPVPGSLVASVGIDEYLPTKKGWRIGLYEAPNFTLPTGSTLTAQAYCKKNS